MGGDAAQRTIEFAGRRWRVKCTPGAAGPGGNVFDDSPETVRVDDGGLFAVQPAATNQHAFPVPPTPWRAGFDWSPARVAFTTSGGASWVCSSSAVPASGPVQPRINLWLYEGAAPKLGLPVTVTIDDFRYTPPSS